MLVSLDSYENINGHWLYLPQFIPCHFAHDPSYGAETGSLLEKTANKSHTYGSWVLDRENYRSLYLVSEHHLQNKQ